MTSACREYQGRRNEKNYARAPLGDQRIDSQGRRRGRKMVLVHRWVFEQLTGRKLAPGEVVMHSCDNPPCFLFEHLSLGTPADNNADMLAKGRQVSRQGEAHGLSDEQIREIRALTPGVNPARMVAARFGVSETLVHRIRAGKHRANA